ncbi:hypothetical protein C8R44DRAFT_866645 [Mycena epipterygia]|nr:hypothetical protein C8R44DRAFT_866645 [Mycena epipterygia]
MANPSKNSTPYSESANERARRRVAAGVYKRLLVFCDGTGQQTDAPVARPEKKKTWTDTFNGAKSWVTGNTAPPEVVDAAQATSHKDWVPASNVTRLCRIVSDVDYKGGKEIEQMSFYQNGVATGALTALGETWSGAFGVGLNENVCEVYIWLCLNWIPGDEIFIFGFSRGAFTARAISGLVNHLGIIDRSNLGSFHSIYDAYMRRAEEGHEQTWADMKTTFPEAKSGRGGGDVKIKIVGVWDTVKSLGFPENERVRAFTHAFGWDRKHAFHDATTCDNVENAFHALALDERRAAFSPLLWHLPEASTKTNLQQCWFPGSHSDVGGSYEDAQPYDSSDLSLLWMIRQCRTHLAFDERRLDEVFSARDAEWWGAQPMHDSFSFEYHLNGQERRKPGQYFEMQHVAPLPTAVAPLKEFIHPSVRLRLLRAQEDGVRVEGETKLSHKYDSAAMAGFTLKLVNDTDPKQGYKWVKQIVHEGKHSEVQLMEDRLGEEERSMLPDNLLKLLDNRKLANKLEFPMAEGEKAALEAAEKGTKPGMVKRALGYIGL